MHDLKFHDMPDGPDETRRIAFRRIIGNGPTLVFLPGYMSDMAGSKATALFTKAREDEERVKNEAQAYANGIVPEARGFAQRQLEEANAYREQVIANADGEAKRFNQLLAEYRKAPEVTRERLYLDAVQSVLGQTNKVMVDDDGGSNLMYLPLDKLATQGAAAGMVRDLRVDSSNIRELTNAVTEQIRRDQAAMGSRRGGR